MFLLVVGVGVGDEILGKRREAVELADPGVDEVDSVA